MLKKLYRCTSTLQWNFLQISAIYTKSSAQTFPAIFLFFAIFDRNFVELVAPTSDKNKNCIGA